MSSPRILHIAAVEYTIRRLVLPQLTALAEHGCEVIVACAPEGERFDESLKPFDPRVLRFPREIGLSRLMGAAGAQRRLVREVDPDLVHFHTPAAALPGRAVLAVSRSARPLVAQTVHGTFGLSSSSRLPAKAVPVVERLLSRATDLSLFVSAEDLQEAIRTGHKGLLRYVGNGVGSEWFVEEPRPRNPSEPLRAVFVGRLVKEKGVLDLLHAIAANENVDLTIVGDQLPSDRDGLGAAARRLAEGLPDRVRLTGMVEPAEVRQQLARADVMILPSLREGLPMSVIEAMASALPIIATSIRGCRELVIPGVNGWLFAPGDRDELAKVLRQASETQVEELTAMGRASLERAKRYQLSDAIAAVLSAYRELGLVV